MEIYCEGSYFFLRSCNMMTKHLLTLAFLLVSSPSSSASRNSTLAVRSIGDAISRVMGLSPAAEANGGQADETFELSVVNGTTLVEGAGQGGRVGDGGRDGGSNGTVFRAIGVTKGQSFYKKTII
jgi:hypothetical protein